MHRPASREDHRRGSEGPPEEDRLSERAERVSSEPTDGGFPPTEPEDSMPQLTSLHPTPEPKARRLQPRKPKHETARQDWRAVSLGGPRTPPEYTKTNSCVRFTLLRPGTFRRAVCRDGHVTTSSYRTQSVTQPRVGDYPASETPPFGRDDSGARLGCRRLDDFGDPAGGVERGRGGAGSGWTMGDDDPSPTARSGGSRHPSARNSLAVLAQTADPPLAAPPVPRRCPLSFVGGAS